MCRLLLVPSPRVVGLIESGEKTLNVFTSSCCERTRSRNGRLRKKTEGWSGSAGWVGLGCVGAFDREAKWRMTSVLIWLFGCG